MPLLDHSEPSVSVELPWASVHSMWANTMYDALRASLPRRFYALINARLGFHIEADVAEYDRAPDDAVAINGHAGGVAVATSTYAPPEVSSVLNATFTEEIEIEVKDPVQGGRVVAVIELVSESNKDRESSRRAFVGKCAAYLQKGVGLVVVDIVTIRRANLHQELIELMGQPDLAGMPAEAFIYATAYRPVYRERRAEVDVWAVPLAVGEPLPVLPLALMGVGCIPLDLEATYNAVRRRAGI